MIELWSVLETRRHIALWRTAVPRNGGGWTLGQAAGWCSQGCSRGWGRPGLHWWRYTAIVTIGWSETCGGWWHSNRRHCSKHLSDRNWCALRLHSVSLSLRCQSSFGFITMALAFAVFLVCILYRDFFVHQILAVHIRDCGIRGFKVAKRDESISFREVRLVARNLAMDVSLRKFVREDVQILAFGAATNVPNLPNVSYRTLSSTMGSKLPTKSSAPTSTDLCLSALALFTRIGLP